MLVQREGSSNGRSTALVVASLLSSTAIANAASKFVILTCNTLNQGVLCDKSTGVVASCPPVAGSCAQAVAVFTSAPDNLKLINVGTTSTSEIFLTIYTLGKD
jgi:hypothetical protein